MDLWYNKRSKSRPLLCYILVIHGSSVSSSFSLVLFLCLQWTFEMTHMALILLLLLPLLHFNHAYLVQPRFGHSAVLVNDR